MYIKYFLIIGICFFYSCANKEASLSPIIFDLDKAYPEKELDYAKYYNIEYHKVRADSLALGSLQIIYVSNDSIITFSKSSPSIYIFKRSGKLLSHFNKEGNSGEEYLGISDAFYDKVRKEIYVLDLSKGQIIVYDLSGKFQRRFLHNRKETRIVAMRNYSDGEFICYNNTFGIIKENGNTYSIISKQTGETVRNIRISIPEKITPYTFHAKGVYGAYEIPFGYSKEGIYLNESSCDTIYRLNPQNGEMIPAIIKTPAILSYDTSLRHFLYVIAETPGYISFYKLTVKQQQESPPSRIASYFFYDKSDGQIYEEATLLPLDNKSSNPFATGQIVSSDFYGESIHAYTLKKRSAKKRLKGELKELADSMDEKDNPVIQVLITK